MTGALVLKLGGELLESLDGRSRIAAAVASLAATRPLVVVHGGGRAVDAALDRQGISPRKIDGLRITDGATLDVVVSVLGGQANIHLVAALVGQGLSAVGLTGVDAGFGRAARTAAHRTSTGEVVDLGLVGDPADPDPSLIELLLAHGHLPVVASLGLESDGMTGSGVPPRVLNVNADVMACRIAAALGAADLVIAGATPGVLDQSGRTVAELDLAGIDALVADLTASAGMIAKLLACRAALADGVASIRIVDGRSLDVRHGVEAAPGTTLLARKEAGATVPAA